MRKTWVKRNQEKKNIVQLYRVMQTTNSHVRKRLSCSLGQAE